MAELTHDAEDGFHEIQLSGKQLVFLFMATTVVSVVIFLCGVLVGRGVRAERGEDPGVVAAAPVTPPTTNPGASEAPTPPAETPLSYPERLRREPAAAETLKRAEPAVKPPAPQQEAVPHEPPPPDTDHIPWLSTEDGDRRTLREQSHSARPDISSGIVCP